jgi:outer membrane protein TolC
MKSAMKASRAAALVFFLYATSGVTAHVHAQVSSQPSTDTLRLTLRDAAAMAAQRNPAVVAARARVAQSEARVTAARSALLPQVSAYAADGAHTMNTATFGIDFPSPPGQPPLFDPNGEVIGPIHIVDTRARLSQSLFNMAARERTRGARAAVDASDASAFAIASEAASGASAAYVRVQRAMARVSARRADIALSEELVQIAQNQLSAGVGVALDVTRARARLSTLQAQLIADRNEVAHAQLALTDALGAPAGQPVILVDTLGPAAARLSTDEAAVALALAGRRDIQAMDQQIRASQIAARAIAAERYPSVAVVGDDGFIGKSWNHLLNTYTINAQVSVPLFTGYAQRAREQEQSAVVTELQARREDLRRQVEREVRDALLDRRSTDEQVAAARASVALAEQQVAQSRERFTTGVSGNADLVEASLVLSNARSVLVDALAAAALADVALLRAEGTAGIQ